MATLQNHIENLRAKPHHIRKRIAFWSSFGVTALIAVFWVASMTSSGTPVQGAVAKAVNKANPPGQSLVAAVGSLFGDVRDLVMSPKKVEYGAIEVVAGER